MVNARVNRDRKMQRKTPDLLEARGLKLPA